MKKFKTLSIAIATVLLLIGAGPSRFAFAECRATSLSLKSMVAVSTNIASPTTLISPTIGACQEVKLLLHWSGSGTKPNNEYLLLSDTNSGFSSSASTGSIRIPAGNLPNEFFDLGEYAGPLYAVVIGTTGAGTTAPNVSVLKRK